MKNTLALAISTMLVMACNSGLAAETHFLRSSFNLEDPNGYCLDIPGFGPRLQRDAPINTHTCKYNRPGFSVDEEFEVTSLNYFRMPEYDLCLAASTLEAGSPVNTLECTVDTVHAWTMHSGGRVTPSDAPSLCLTLSGEKVYVNSSVGNLTPNSTRSVSLENCSSDLRYRQSWRWSDPDELDTLNANTLRAGMNATTAARIRELGNAVRPPETAELYAAQTRMFSTADVSISDEIEYGKEEGQRLQVYSGLNRNHPRRAAPVILLVHGGGFTRGGLTSLANAATHFAGLGYVAVNMTYPLAPKATWPSGAQSVAAAVRWVRKNAKEIKGNPDEIFVLGHSAGGAHVADFVFRPGIVDGAGPLVAGAILASPVVALNPQANSANSVAYFGKTTAEWQDKQALGNIERTSIPVLTLVAEFDPDSFQNSSVKLLNELVVDKRVATRFRQMRGHNHTSYMQAIGTSDTQAAEEIIDFMATAGRN